MSNLAEYQHDMAGLLLGQGSHVSEIAASHVNRLAIYKNNVRSACYDVLADNYEVTRRLVGDHCFMEMVQAYLYQSPPDRQQLALYGQTFADFIASLPVVETLPYLPDMAKLEWLMVESFHAPEAISLRADQVAAALGDGSRGIGLHPSCRLFASLHPVFSIWQLHRQHQNDDGLSEFELSEQGECMLIFRYQQAAHIKLIDGTVFRLLKAFCSDASTEVSINEEQFCHPAVIDALSQLIAKGLFVLSSDCESTDK